MRPACTRWAASSATVGRSGTAGSATMSAASSAAKTGSVARFADRLLGSPEIYGHKEREPEQSVNFVTCHDGFTLNDLVSYNQKHNEANGEDNRDGADDNRSWNCGVEGPTDDPAVEKLRNRQVKNFLTVTMLSLGVPMILMGDEVRRTQRGNNNAYCQDNEISWFDWTLVDEACGCAPLREAAHRTTAVARHGARAPAPEPEPTAPAGEKHLARREARPAGLGRLFAQPGVQRGDAEGEAASPPDPECLLGAARLRAAAGGQRRGRTRGADGSTPPSIRRTTSSNGRRRRRFQATPIGPRRDPWWCCSLSLSDRSEVTEVSVRRVNAVCHRISAS